MTSPELHLLYGYHHNSVRPAALTRLFAAATFRRVNPGGVLLPSAITGGNAFKVAFKHT
jgi:hypothetical protein